jgi:hypothetical protein
VKTAKSIYTYELTLGKAVGPIQLGATRAQIIQILGEPEKSRTYSLSIEDSYRSIGLSLEYRPADGLCNHITVWSPSQLMYEGQDLLMLSWYQLEHWFGLLDSEFEAVYDGWQSDKVGIAIHPKRNEDGSFSHADFINVFDKKFYPSEEEIDAEVQREIDELPSDEEIAKELWGQFDEPS